MGPLSRDEVRAVDRCAIETLGIAGAVLMENAGRNVADAIEDLLGGAAGRRIAIVAGAGNNGGDGFVIARHLLLRGAEVAMFLVVPEEKIQGDARANLDILRKLSEQVRPLAEDDLPGLGSLLGEYELIVDAVGGTGIRGALRGAMAAAAEQINAAGRRVVAVDIPSGLDCDTGAAEGPTVRAELTVTFVARKKGFDAPGAEAYTGRVLVADIGVPADLPERLGG